MKDTNKHQGLRNQLVKQLEKVATACLQSNLQDRERVISRLEELEIIFKPYHDELQKIQVWINERKNQNKFKLSLLKKYNSQCLISKIKIPELIEAAHIFPHSKSGKNNIANGVLLRSDLHILFDCGLLSINPENFKVIIFIAK